MPRAPVAEPAPSPMAGLLAAAIGPNDAVIPPNPRDPAHEPKAKQAATPKPEPVNEPPPLTESVPADVAAEVLAETAPMVKERPDFPYAPFVMAAFDALVKSLGWQVFGEGNKTTLCRGIPISYRRVCHIIERGVNGERIPWPDDEAWRTGSLGA
jgi:hypothetical protein